MMRQLISRSFLILWVFAELRILSVETTELKNSGAVRNGWQPLLNYDNVGGNPLPQNYQFAQTYYEPEHERSYKSQKQQRKPPQQEPSNQHDYTPPSILGSFSIFGHSVPKYRDEEPKNHRETVNNKNEYDFLMPPPRQKLEPYQKIKVAGDSYGGPSHYRDIYTPLNNHFTFVPTNGAASVLKKHPQTLYREEAQIYPLRQYPTSIESQHKPHQVHQKLPLWMHPHRENNDPYHMNYRQHLPIHNEAQFDTGNRYYTQISPPSFKQSHEFQKSPKPIKNHSDYATLNPVNLYVVQASTSPRNELLPITTTDSQLIPQHIEHYLFEQNSVGKPPQTVDNQYYISKQRENATTGWPISSTKYSELLPNYNNPIEFKNPDDHTRILPERILPVVPTKQYETPESISLKHFNEQQYLLQQQLLERDRMKLKEFNKLNNLAKLVDKPVESTTVNKIIDQFEIYESVRLMNGERNSPERRPTVNDNVKHVNNSPSTNYSGKKKKINNNRLVIPSESTDYDHQVIPDGQQYSFENNHNSWKPSNSAEFITEIKPTVTTPSEALRKLPQRLTTRYEQASTITPNVTRKLPQKSTTQYEQLSTKSPDFSWKLPQKSTPHYEQLSTTSPDFTRKLPQKSTTYYEQLSTTSPDFTRNLPQKSTTYYERSSTASPDFTRKLPQKSTTYYEQSSTTPPALTRKLPQKSTTQYQISSTIAPIETTRTTTKTRSQNRNPTRRRRPIIEAEQMISSVQPELSTITTESLNNHQSPTESLQIITIKEEANETPPIVEEKVNTLIPSELINVKITDENHSTARPTTIQYDHVESTSSTIVPEDTTRAERSRTTKIPERIRTTVKSPERIRATTKSPERIRSTTRNYYSIEPLEQLFNLTEISNNETSTEASEMVTIIDDFMKNDTEMTTKPYRLRPMKYGNNTRPRFSVKDYKSRLDYRNRMSQTTEVSPTTAFIKSKGMGKYKYTPRNSYPKMKSTTPSLINRTNDFEPEIRKIKNPNRYNGGYRNRGSNQTDVDTEIKGNFNISTKAESKFIQPIRRRPHLKSSGQLAQMMKRNRNNTELNRPTKMPVTVITESLELKNETFATEEALKLKITENGDFTNEYKGEKINEEISESTTPEITKDSLLNSSLQSDEEVFAKASQSVADLTSSASALYNKPGMFKALSSMPYYESEHKKSFKPTFDDTSLPIEAFFHGLTQSKE